MLGRWLRSLQERFSHFRTDSDIEDEIRSHMEMAEEEGRAQGISAEEARRRARLELGNKRVLVERIRDGEWITAAEGWMRDLAHGFRTIRRSPLLFLTAAVTMGLGVGATTTVFSFLYGLVLRPIPTKAPSELMYLGLVSRANPNGINSAFVTYRMLKLLEKNLSSFREMSGWDALDVNVGDKQGSIRRHSAGLVTGNGFSVIPMRPYLGRLISPFDDVRGGSPQGWPVVLSYGYWNDEYGADRAIIGGQIKVAGVPVTVVGVTPPGFDGLWRGYKLELYLPMHFADAMGKGEMLDSPNTVYRIHAIGRLSRGASAAKASAELVNWRQRLLSECVPAKYQHDLIFEGAGTRVSSARSGLPSYVTHVYADSLYLMQGLTGIILVLCCVNVSGLMLAKVFARGREFAVRTALGAQSWQLVRQYLTESFLIAATGSAIGALIAWRSADLFLPFFRDPMMGQPMDVHPDRSVFVFAALLAVATTFAFGLVPAWRAARADPGDLLKSRSTLGGKRQVAGRAFIPIQVALSLALVAIASLLSQSLIKLRSEQTGFDTDHVTIQTSPFYLIETGGDTKLNLYGRMVDRLREMPGIRSASVTSRTPLTGEPVNSNFSAASEGSAQSPVVSMAFNDVGPYYFETMRVPILAGREFRPAERSLKVCVLNQTAARLLFRNKQPMGQYVSATNKRDFPEGTTCRVIGIAKDAKFSDVRQPPPPTIYFPVSLERFDAHIGVLVFLINADTKRAASDGFRRALADVAPTIPTVIFATLREQMDAALGSQELITLLNSFFGLLSLLLSALGLYGLLSSSVAQRTSEIGLRMALGGSRAAVIRMILREALGMLSSGMLGGAGILIFAVRFVASMLHGVSSFDPITLIAVAVLLGAVTVAAAFVPAWRAAKIDPMEALRGE